MGSTLKQLRYQPLLPPVLSTAAIALSMVAMLVLSAPQVEAKTLGGTYKGLTSQGQPGLIRTPNGHRITVAKVQLAMNCSDGGAFIMPATWKPMPILPNGTFGEVLTGSGEEEGAVFNIRAKLSGRFNKDRTEVTAKAEFKLISHEADGSVVTCDSGVVTLHAQA